MEAYEEDNLYLRAILNS